VTPEPFTALRVISDIALIVAGFAMASLLLYLFRRRPDLSFRWVFVAFAVLLVAMALSNLVRFSGPAVSAAAALVAGAAAVLAMAYLLRVIPIALSLPGERALAEMNERLQREVDERVRAEERLKQLNDELERRVQERTQELRESEERYRMLYQKTPVMMHSIDPQGRILSVNERWLQVLGYTREQVIGHRSTEFMTEESRRYAEDEVLPAFFRTGVAYDVSYRYRTSSGEERDILLSAVTEREQEGQVRLGLSVLVDVTERKRAEQALRESEERLRLALDAARMCIWEYDVDSEAMRWSRGAEDLFALLASQLPARYEDYLQRLHPDDVQAVKASAQDLLDGRAPSLLSEHRVLWPDGSVRWIEARGSAHRDGRGRPVRMLGTIVDITREKARELELAESEQRYRSVIGVLSEGVMVIAPDGQTLTANDSAHRILGLTHEQMMGRKLRDPEWKTVYADGTPFPVWDYPAARTLETGAPFRDVLMGVYRRADDLRWITINTYPLNRDGSPKPYAVVVSFTDVTDRNAAEAQRRIAEGALRASEAKFASVFRICPEAISISDWSSGEYLDVNEAYERVFGYTREQAVGKSALDLSIWVDPLERADLQRRLEYHGRVDEFEARLRRADGEIRIGQMSVESLPILGRRCLLIVLRDVTRQRAQEEELRLAARVFESTAEGILITDARERIVAANLAFAELTGYSEEEVRGKTPALLRSGRHDRRFYDEMWAAVNRTGRWHGEMWNRTKGGEVRPYLLTVTALKDERGVVLNYVGVMRDISTIKQSQQQLEYLANYDALTGLGNRNLFYTRLKIGIEKAQRHKGNLAVVFIDLDNFKVINDTLGHDVGDVLLSEVARRIKTCVRQEDVVCRLGGDEFTVYVEDFTDPESLVGTTQRLTQVIAEPYRISGQEIFVTASAGISVYPNDGKSISELVKNADTAMYKVKEQGKNGFQFFREDMNARAFERLVFVSGLRRALERNEFRLAYQPQIHLASGSVHGAECLLRWQHPEMGEVPPGSFIPVAEETGLIVNIGEWVLREVCQQLRAWGGALAGQGHVSVNISARQFRQPELVHTIRRAVAEAGIVPSHLGVEITESALMDDPQAAATTLARLKDMGLTISIDDFGTGYSSLSYLKRFPIDCLKIDRTFVRDIATDPDDAAIVTAVIQMAKSLKLHVIAEGVETEDQLNFLRERGCEGAQGYYFAKPLPAEQVASWLAKQ
jgi:diguanylate cyclase (GGDEF)-like protein/PAS domain S-box-containing protein